jgi:YesN/AraC family two-component response regulator
MDNHTPHRDPVLPPLRVLIVDDRIRTRKGLFALLSTCNELEVIGEAENGYQAVLSVDEKIPDVVVMDVRMPRMDGLEATRIIKDRHPKTKVIIISIYPSYLNDAYASGADTFLIKGCPADELVDTILNCCHNNDQSDTLTPDEIGEDKNGPLYPDENPDIP